jgi:hypothetical protein
MFSFLRPKPKFEVGSLVESTPAADIERRYIIITSRRWVRPEGTEKKQWVYDGPLFGIEGGKIVRRVFMWGVLENSLEYVCGPSAS